jgi:hypothetical protein
LLGRFISIFMGDYGVLIVFLNCDVIYYRAAQ